MPSSDGLSTYASGDPRRARGAPYDVRRLAHARRRHREAASGERTTAVPLCRTALDAVRSPTSSSDLLGRAGAPRTPDRLPPRVPCARAGTSRTRARTSRFDAAAARARSSCRRFPIVGTGLSASARRPVTAHVARLLARDRRDVVVAMGRGGPARARARSRRSRASTSCSPSRAPGRHAASDHLETAALVGVTTIGCRRAGGGLAGAVSTRTSLRAPSSRARSIPTSSCSTAAAPRFLR
jgi:hypothetical protein